MNSSTLPNSKMEREYYKVLFEPGIGHWDSVVPSVGPSLVWSKKASSLEGGHFGRWGWGVAPGGEGPHPFPVPSSENGGSAQGPRPLPPQTTESYLEGPLLSLFFTLEFLDKGRGQGEKRRPRKRLKSSCKEGLAKTPFEWVMMMTLRRDRGE